MLYRRWALMLPRLKDEKNKKGHIRYTLLWKEERCADWIATATHQVQQAQINKLNTIINSHTTMQGTGAPGITTTMIARVQDINDAYSTVVNMDYFPITVNQLPIVNGQRLTAPQFFGTYSNQYQRLRKHEL